DNPPSQADLRISTLRFFELRFRLLCRSELLRRLSVAEFLSVKIDDSDLLTVFQLDVTEFVQMRLPKTVLREIVGHAFGDQNVPSIAAIHHSLRDIDSHSSDIRSVIDIFDLIDRAAVDAHPQPNLRMVFQRPGNFHCTLHWLLRSLEV